MGLSMGGWSATGASWCSQGPDTSFFNKESTFNKDLQHFSHITTAYTPKKVNFCSGIPGPILLHVAIPTDKLLWFCCLRTTFGLIENMSPRVINSPPKSSNKFHCLWEAIGEKIAVGNEIMVCAEKPLLTTNSCVIFASPSPAPRQYCLGI